ncbi:MAG: trypsin-like peptidase domain-containing protein [Planctomycetes bacterium]|nr:trypsin-like peptidase domain-containing protein [Planctomycetota bacterium]
MRIVGHFYLCTECDDWHFSGSSGFCVAKDGVVATCRHVLDSDETMREAFLVVADLDGHVWPVQRVLAQDRASDVCLLQSAEKGGVPLPLRANVRAGERVYCLSNPDHHFGFFSEGLVARRYRARESEVRVEGALLPVVPWLHVTCAFGAGSSGAPIVDGRGNVVGIAQSTTAIVNDAEDGGEETQLVLRTAAPAAAVADLVRIVATSPDAR